MNYLEILGTAIGIVYLYLEYRASAWLWVASIAMPAIYLVVYYKAGLYADFGISIYYILASLYGLIYWLRRKDKETREDKDKQSGISHIPRSYYLPLGLVFAALFFVMGFILQTFTDSTVPWADAFTTSLSIIAMWLLARKYLEQWLFWIAADLGCALLYAYKDLWFTGGLYFAYAIIAVFGYRKWKNLMRIKSPSHKNLSAPGADLGE